MPRVSVLIPLYNKAAHIRRTMDSIFAQTFDDYEVVVVDDGSTDDGPAIIESYQDARVRLIRQPNAGPGAARNRGIREAKGVWIAPLDADDAWEPTFLEYMLQQADAAPDCEVVTCVWYTDAENKSAILDRFRSFNAPFGEYRLERGADPTTMRRLMSRFGCRNTIAKREAILATTGFHEASRHGEDLYLWLQLLLNGRLFLGDAVLGFHDLDASELSHGRRRKGLSPMPRPVVSDPDPIRAHCPEPYAEQLERLLLALARREAWHQILAGRLEVARGLLEDYPAILEARLDRLKFKLWMHVATRQHGKPVAEWSGTARRLFKHYRFLRIKSGSL